MADRSSERGAILIMVAVSLLVLLTFTAFVVDYGIMWTARGQAQTAADAAALAGAYSLAFDNTTPATVRARARAVGRSNYVWMEQPDIQDTDIEIVNCPDNGPILPASTTPECVKATAYRTNRNGRTNPMPTWFASLVGIEEQGVVATATARATAANGASCIKPWVVGDKWLEVPGPWNQTSLYEPATGDSYIPPSATATGNGFSELDANGRPTYYGYQMILKLASPGLGVNEIPINSAGWAMEVDLHSPTATGSTPSYRDNITGCTDDIVAISPPDETCATVDPERGCLQVKLGSTGNNNARAIADFIANHDPTAQWVNGDIDTTMTTSSRIVPIAIFSVPEYLSHGYTGHNGIVRVVNIVGFFLEGTCETVTNPENYLQCPGHGNDKAAIVGRVVNYPGVLVPSGGTIKGAFGEMLVLVR